VAVAAVASAAAAVDSVVMLAIDMSKPFKSGSVLLVTDVLHPIDNFSHQGLLNGKVRHSSGRACAVPMLLSWGKPDHIARPDFLNRAIPTLRPSQTRGND
jgi:hypothetical protein